MLPFCMGVVLGILVSPSINDFLSTSITQNWSVAV